jgi:4,5-dihydroxyphthalate decarboxylase
MAAGPVVLRTAIGRYPHIAALRERRLQSHLVSLDFAEIPTINRAFAPMVRESRFDVCEMAIATFLQAKAYAKPLVLLPVVLAARFQESALLCRAGSDIRGPSDLKGRRVAVRAYSQTTGMWLRGALADGYGVQPEDVRWVTVEDAHVAEYRDPPFVDRASSRQDLVAMLRQGEVDAIIVGNEVPNDPALRTVFPDPEAAAEAFWKSYGFVPVNHLVTVRREIAERRMDVVRDLLRLFRESKMAALPSSTDRDPYPFGCKSLEPAISLALRYTAEQGLLPRRLAVDDVWEGLPAGLDQRH